MKRLNGIWVCLALLWVAMAAQARTMHFYYTDPQGTVLAKTDAQGNILARYDYKPYGGVVSGQGPDGPGYTGHKNDTETGLVYMQARYYDPVGRFLSPDPVSPSAGALFGFNRYDYADNNPTTHIDPTGMACGSTASVSAGVQRMRDASDSCGTASATIVRAFNSSGKAYYLYADGGVVIQSGNRPTRDNNPGDIRKGSPTAISTTHAVGWDYTKTSPGDKITRLLPFAMFSSSSAGEKALEMTLKVAHGNQTISDAIKGYAPAKDHNNPAAYSAYVTSMTHLSPNKTINSLDAKEMSDLAHAFGSMEGMRNAQSTVYENNYGPFSNP